MTALAKFGVALVIGFAAALGPMSASAWWNDHDDDYYDRWGGGPWYGGYPGYGWGYPGYGWGYPGYGWGYPGYQRPSTIIVNPEPRESRQVKPAQPRRPR